MSAETNKTANRRFYEEVINQKKLAVVDEVAGPNYISHGFPPGLPPGREGLKLFIGAFHAAFPDGHLTIDQMIAEGDTVATRLTFHGTHTREFHGIAPTGKKVTVPALDMARYEGGKLVEHWGGPDQMSLLQQLGVIPQWGRPKNGLAWQMRNLVVNRRQVLFISVLTRVECRGNGVESGIQMMNRNDRFPA